MTYVIAEVGSAHEGNERAAIDLVAAAAETGVNAVKMQLFRAETLARQDLESPGNVGVASQYERLKSLELPIEVYESAAEVCRRNSCDFIVTPLSVELLEQIEPLVSAIKIASGDLTYHPLIGAAARTGKDVFLSTGMATEDEIRQALDTFYRQSTPFARLTLMHCVSLYPTPNHVANLSRIKRLEQIHRSIYVGYSDHTIGPLACLAAAAMGATAIEKHFTLTPHNPIGDHILSLDPAGMAGMARQIQQIDEMMRSGQADLGMRRFLRRGKDGLRGSYREISE